MKNILILAIAGFWMVGHYRQRQGAASTFKAATQMRKQGVPVEVALAVLAGRVTQGRLA